MGLPKNYRRDLQLYPEKIGEDRRKEILNEIDNRDTFLPKGVYHEDMDKSVVDYINNELTINIRNKKVPAILLSIQRWTEFTKTWKFSDQYKNIKIPFISIVRKPDAQVGTSQTGLFNIPGHPVFNYKKTLTWDGNRIGGKVYQIPQPVPVDLTYEVRFFCTKMRDLNKLNQNVLQEFQSAQRYIKVNGHPMPLMLDTIGDESVINDLEKRRFYVQTYTIKLLGYIVDEEQYKVKPLLNATTMVTELLEEKAKSVTKVVSISIEERTISLKVTFAVGSADIAAITVNNSATYKVVNLTNIDSNYVLSVDGVVKTIPFSITVGQILTFNIDKVDASAQGIIELTGNI